MTLLNHNVKPIQFVSRKTGKIIIFKHFSKMIITILIKQLRADFESKDFDKNSTAEIDLM